MRTIIYRPFPEAGPLQRRHPLRTGPKLRGSGLTVPSFGCVLTLSVADRVYRKQAGGFVRCSASSHAGRQRNPVKLAVQHSIQVLEMVETGGGGGMFPGCLIAKVTYCYREIVLTTP